MFPLLRTAIGPLALTILLALQVVALPQAAAGRGPRISKAAKARTAGLKPRGTGTRGSSLGRQSVTRPLKALERQRAVKLKDKTNVPSKSLRTSKTRIKSKRALGKRAASNPRSARLGRSHRASNKLGSIHSTRASKPGRLQKPIKAIGSAFKKFKSRPGVVRTIAAYTRVRAKMTRTLDGLQARAPPWLAKSMILVRTYSLPSLAAYTLSKVGKDKAFLGTYFAGKAVFSNVLLPASVAIGVDPVLAGILNIVATPITLGVVVLRERHNLRKNGESLSIGKTASAIGREYKEFASARLQKSSIAARAHVTSP